MAKTATDARADAPVGARTAARGSAVTAVIVGGPRRLPVADGAAPGRPARGRRRPRRAAADGAAPGGRAGPSRDGSRVGAGRGAGGRRAQRRGLVDAGPRDGGEQDAGDHRDRDEQQRVPGADGLGREPEQRRRGDRGDRRERRDDGDPTRGPQRVVGHRGHADGHDERRRPRPHERDADRRRAARTARARRAAARRPTRRPRRAARRRGRTGRSARVPSSRTTRHRADEHAEHDGRRRPRSGRSRRRRRATSQLLAEPSDRAAAMTTTPISEGPRLAPRGERASRTRRARGRPSGCRGRPAGRARPVRRRRRAGRRRAARPAATRPRGRAAASELHERPGRPARDAAAPSTEPATRADRERGVELRHDRAAHRAARSRADSTLIGTLPSANGDAVEEDARRRAARREPTAGPSPRST